MTDLNDVENVTASGETDAPQPSAVVENVRQAIMKNYLSVPGTFERPTTALIQSVRIVQQLSSRVNYEKLTSIYAPLAK